MKYVLALALALATAASAQAAAPATHSGVVANADFTSGVIKAADKQTFDAKAKKKKKKKKKAQQA